MIILVCGSSLCFFGYNSKITLHYNMFLQPCFFIEKLEISCRRIMVRQSLHKNKNNISFVAFSLLSLGRCVCSCWCSCLLLCGYYFVFVMYWWKNVSSFGICKNFSIVISRIIHIYVYTCTVVVDKVWICIYKVVVMQHYCSIWYNISMQSAE